MLRKTAIVTGAAGFIGSNLAERLVKEYDVVGIDCFTEYYPKQIKMRNIENLLSDTHFKLITTDLATCNVDNLNADFIFHQAAEPGVRASWGANFHTYVKNNIAASQRILEACVKNPPSKFIFASSSSIYGNVSNGPITEKQTPRPISPYGVTKLAAENLCYLYWKNYGIPTVSLRYFTVYGPNLRPDLAISRFTSAITEDREISVYGDGSQSRDFTYVSDVVEANLLAAGSKVEGETFNIGSGKRITVNRLISLLEKTIGKKAKIRYSSPQKGDVYTTLACIKKAKKELGYAPKVLFEEGLSLYLEWFKAQT